MKWGTLPVLILRHRADNYSTRTGKIHTDGRDSSRSNPWRWTVAERCRSVVDAQSVDWCIRFLAGCRQRHLWRQSDRFVPDFHLVSRLTYIVAPTSVQTTRSLRDLFANCRYQHAVPNCGDGHNDSLVVIRGHVGLGGAGNSKQALARLSAPTIIARQLSFDGMADGNCNA